MLLEKDSLRNQKSKRKGKARGGVWALLSLRAREENKWGRYVGANPAKSTLSDPQHARFYPSFAEELSTQRRSIFKGQSGGIGFGNIRRLSKVKQSSVQSRYETSYLRQSHIFIIIHLSVSTIGRECPYTFNI